MWPSWQIACLPSEIPFSVARTLCAALPHVHAKRRSPSSTQVFVIAVSYYVHASWQPEAIFLIKAGPKAIRLGLPLQCAFGFSGGD